MEELYVNEGMPEGGVSVEVTTEGLADAALVDVLGIERKRHGRCGVLGCLLVIALCDDHSRQLGILALGNRLHTVAALRQDSGSHSP